MFDNRLRNHTLPTIDEDGQLTHRRVTCAEANAFHAPHVTTVTTDDGQGNTTSCTMIVDCYTAEAERRALLQIEVAHAAELKQQAEKIEAQAKEIARLQAVVANSERLMDGAMEIIFSVGPRLGSLLTTDIDGPSLTDDHTAVKVGNAIFVVLINPFDEEIVVRDKAGIVPDEKYGVVNGRIRPHVQTNILGQIERIKQAKRTGVDPVLGEICLVDDRTAS